MILTGRDSKRIATAAGIDTPIRGESKMIRSILIGLDDTDASRHAQELAISLAQTLGAHIAAACVVNVPQLTAPEPVPPGAAHFKHEKDEALIARAETEARGMLDAFAKTCLQSGVGHDTALVHGDPVEELTRAAPLHDLIVLGRDTSFEQDKGEGSREMSRPSLQLVRAAPRPVLIATAKAPGKGPDVVAYDGSLPAMRALQLYCLLGLGKDRETRILSIGQDEDAVRATAETGTRFAAMHGVKAITHAIVSKDDPAAVLRVEAHGGAARLLVMGAYGRRGWRELILGSCTSELLAKSETALFVYH